MSKRKAWAAFPLMIAMMISVMGIFFAEVSNAAVSNGFTYQDNGDGTVIITAYTVVDIYSGVLVIPNTLGGKVVTDIGRGAFTDLREGWNWALTDVILPDGLKTIGNSAFARNNINSIIIPPGVTSIGAEAFTYNQMSEVVFVGKETTISSASNSPSFNM